MLPILTSYWRGATDTYIEPFAGSACLFFHLKPSKAVLGDNNPELIETYEVIRTEPDRIARRLARIPRTPEAYYRWRELEPRLLDRETRALRFLYLNRHCFNGIFRTNGEGKFNVPFGTRLGSPISVSEIRACAERLLEAKLIAGDFEKTICTAKRGDFVYMDPPFAMSKRRNRREYGHTAFSECDIERLCGAMQNLDQKGARFVVSYGDSHEARQIARGWNHKRVRVRRHVAGFSGDRRSAYELVISNIDPVSPRS